MNYRHLVRLAYVLTIVFMTPSLRAQDRPPYGPAIGLETAKRIAVAAAAEARKNNWRMAIAIVDPHGLLVYYELGDDTQTGSSNIAIEKAKTAAMFRRPSKEFEENVAAGRVAIIALPGVTPIEGGIPIVIGGKIVGAIGVSGGSSAQDAQVAKVGTDVVTKP